MNVLEIALDVLGLPTAWNFAYAPFPVVDFFGTLKLLPASGQNFLYFEDFIEKFCWAGQGYMIFYDRKKFSCEYGTKGVPEKILDLAKALRKHGLLKEHRNLVELLV